MLLYHHRNHLIRWLLAGLLLSALSLGLAYMIRQVMGDNTIGADFYIYWQAGRSAFVDGMSPYSADVTGAIQMGIYGQPAQPGQDQVAFAYPVYALVFIYPFIWLDFPDAQALWMSVFMVAWVIAAIAFSNTASRWAGASAIFMYPLSFGILLGNFNILVGLALFILLRIMMLGVSSTKNQQVAAGLCMAVCLVKPQMSWIFLLLSFWLALRWRMWRQLSTFFLASGLLLAFSIVKFPGWIVAWLEQSRRYNSYITPETLPLGLNRIFLPEKDAQVVAFVLLGLAAFVNLLMVWRWTRAPKSPPGSQRDWLLMGQLGLLTYLLHPWPKSYEQIVILVPFFFWIYEISRERKLAAVLIWMAGLLFSWSGLVDQLTGLTRLGIYAWPILFFASWQAAAWLALKKTES